MKYKIRNIISNALIIFFIILVINFFLQVFALSINKDVNDVQFIVGNQAYTIDEFIDLNSITIDSSYIMFNSTSFYVSSLNDITVSLVYLSDNIMGAGNGDKVLEFYATTIGGRVWFNISGFPVGNEYIVMRGGNIISNTKVNSSGYISFSNNVWSNQRFEIFQEKQSDVVLPVISDVNFVCSDPLDTELGFGWENISCRVTDNTVAGEVFLNIMYPDSSTVYVSMFNIPGTDYYYYNTSFSSYGNYNYYIWVEDVSGNTYTSNSFTFSLSPNWDINHDGVCNVFDQVLISNIYGKTGDPGWLREDVDNNGAIQVFDLVLVSNNYGKSWWNEV